MPGHARSLLPALLVLGGLALVAALYVFGGDAYFRLRQAAGLKPFMPFLDLHNVVAAVACWHEGVDVYATNPCDALGRLHIYGPHWLRLPAWVGNPAVLNWLGVALALGFAAALPALPWPEGRGRRVLLLLAVGSPVTGFALERANMDVPIFTAMVVAALLLGRGFPGRCGAYALFVGAALLKFYPLVLLGLVVRERPRVALATGAVAVAVLAMVVWPLREEFRRAIANVGPHAPFTDTFGAGQLAGGLAVLLPAAGWVGIAVTLAVLAGGTVLAWRVAGGLALAGLPARHRDLFLVGATVLVGCFLAGQNVEYRAVFLLMVLPALLWAAAPVFRVTAVVAAVLMWDPLLRRVVGRLAPGSEDLPSAAGLVAWGLREVAWWWVAAVLAGGLAALLLPALRRYSAPWLADSQAP